MKNSKLLSLSYSFLLFLVSFHYAKATDYYLTSGGTGQPRTPTEWTTDPTGATIVNQPIDFSGNHTWHVRNRPSVSLSGAWNISSGGIVIIGDGATSTSLTISTAFGNINTNALVNVDANGTLIISNTAAVNLNTLHSTSTIVYNASVTMHTLTFGNVVISGANVVLGNKSGGTVINGNLNLTTDLTMSGRHLILLGSISGSGGIVGDNSARLDFGVGNGGNFGTVNFASGARMLNIFYVSFNSGASYVTLGTDLSIVNSGIYFQDIGGIDLNGNSLIFDNSSDGSFPTSSTNGVIKSSTGSIYINGTIGATSGSKNLFMDGTMNTLKVLSLNSSGETLTLANAVKVADSVSVLAGSLASGGNLTLISNTNLKGRISRVGGTITGNINVETFVPGGSAGWANIGTPGINGQTVASWDDASNGTAPGIPMTCTGCFYDPSVAGGFTSIQDWNESTGTYGLMSASSGLAVGKGFWVYVASNLSSATPYTLRNTGTAVTGNTAIAISKSLDGYNLVANPYASPIDWNKSRVNVGTTATFSSNAIYMYNADFTTHASYVNGASNAGGSNIIPSGQGFYVEALTAGNLAFDEEDKMASNTSDGIKKQAASGAYGSIFHLDFAGGGAKDQTTFRIHQSATPLFDGAWDAHKLYPSLGGMFQQGAPSFLSISSEDITNEEYSINSLPPLAQNVTIPLKIKVPANGTYSITLSEDDVINTCYDLRDNLLNVTHDLKTGPYSFTSADTAFNSTRFELQLCKDNTISTVGISSLLNESNVLISQDADGLFVRSRFEENTTSQISAYNIVGQKLMSDVTVRGTENTTRLPLDVNNQVVIIKVVSDQGTVTKKIIKH